MNRIKMFIFALCAIFFSSAASAATVATMSAIPYGSVGLNDEGYWAGVMSVNINGQTFPAMINMLADDMFWPDPFVPISLYDGSPWEVTIYTQDDILNGAPVSYDPYLYSRAAVFFLQSLLGYAPANDPLWAAGFNEMVSNTMGNKTMTELWFYSERVYDPINNPGVTLLDVYDSLLPTLDDNLDYRSFMVVAKHPYMVGELLVYTGNNPIPQASSVPIPASIWLFGSGILGLVAVARTKTMRV